MSTQAEDLLKTAHVDRESLFIKLDLLDQVKENIENLTNLERFINQFKSNGAEYLDQQELLTQVSIYRASFARLEQLLQEIAPPNWIDL